MLYNVKYNESSSPSLYIYVFYAPTTHYNIVETLFYFFFLFLCRSIFSMLYDWAWSYSWFYNAIHFNTRRFTFPMQVNELWNWVHLPLKHINSHIKTEEQSKERNTQDWVKEKLIAMVWHYFFCCTYLYV